MTKAGLGTIKQEYKLASKIPGAQTVLRAESFGVLLALARVPRRRALHVRLLVDCLSVVKAVAAMRRDSDYVEQFRRTPNYSILRQVLEDVLKLEDAGYVVKLEHIKAHQDDQRDGDFWYNHQADASCGERGGHLVAGLQ